MVTRSTVVASLVVVVLLAGCSGLVGDAGGPDSPEEFEHAEGFSADGVEDGEAAARSYREALTNRSSFTVVYHHDVTSDGEVVTYEVVYSVDVDGEAAYHSVEVPSEDYLREDYFGDDRQFTRVDRGGDEQTASGDSEFAPEQLTGVEAVSRLLSNETDYGTSVADRDGTPVVVYETGGEENASAVFAIEPENVSSFDAEFAVDADGLVRDASYELVYAGENGTEQTVTLDFEVRDVGETTVERPEWADEA